MRAIILAAGTGTRLGKYTENLPKCMLRFAGKTLIERQVETLRAAGISDIVVIRGYMPEKITVPGVRYYLNKDFAVTNMVETLFTAEKELNGDVLVCYGDIIYELRVLKAVLASKAEVGVTVDSDYWEYWSARCEKPEDDMESLVVKDGKIVELGDTQCTRDKAQVRYVGLIKFSAHGIEAFKKVYHENRAKYFHVEGPWMQSKSFKKAYMTCMLQALINSGQTVVPIVVQRGWVEFDTVEDYEKYNQWLKEGSLGRFIEI